MVHKINWSRLAIKSFEDNLYYLETNWTKKEIDKFLRQTSNKLELLTKFPQLGSVTIQRKNIRKTLIGKRIQLIYRINQKEGAIELIKFHNSWQHPDRMTK